MLTGFHGFHVTMGTIMLFVILMRSMAGHFKPDNHFGFEAVAWYWHFVDVVWLGLFYLRVLGITTEGDREDRKALPRQRLFCFYRWCRSD